MNFKDTLTSLEKDFILEREKEFKENCEKYADTICKDAIECVKRTLKYETYKIKTEGFFLNKKTVKYFEDCTYPITVFNHTEGPSPRYTFITDDTLLHVKSEQERKYFVDSIIKKLENEGFKCWTTNHIYYTDGVVVKYKMEWE